MYRLRLGIQARSLLVVVYFIIALGWLAGALSSTALAAEEYIPPDRGLPDRRESGGARFVWNE